MTTPTQPEPSAISIGAGTLYLAPLLAALPTDLTSAWNAAYTQVGYTTDGSKFEYDITTGDIMVAESLDIIKVSTSGRAMTVTFTMAQMTATNLNAALNGGTVVVGASVITYTPPVIGSEQRTMIGFQSLDGLERWVWKQCLQTGNVTISRQKAPTYSTIPATFRLELPSAGGAPFQALFDLTRA